MSASKRRRDPEETREKIDEAALKLFAEKGFSATATAEIASRAGVAEGTIFRHYANKKALLLGVMRPVIERVLAPLVTRSVRQLLEQRHDSVEALLRALIDDRIEIAHHVPRIARVMIQEATLHPELRDMVATVFLREVRPPFRAQLASLQERGLIDATLDEDSVMRMIVSVFGGYVVLAHLLYEGRGVFDDAREIDQMVRVLARGLAPGS